MMKELSMMKHYLPEIRHDLRMWRAGDALDTEREDNIFEPNTVAILAALYPGLTVEPWNAEGVIDQVTDKILADTRDAVDLAFEEHIRSREIQRRNAKAAKTRIENQLANLADLPPLQKAVFAAEEALRKNAPDYVPDHAILQWLLYDAPREHRRASATLFNVQRARKALRAKGL